MTRVCDIIQLETKKILAFSTVSQPTLPQAGKFLHKPEFQKLDAILYKWFIFKCSERAFITGPLLTEKAKQLYKKMGWASKLYAHFEVDNSQGSRIDTDF